MCKKSINFINKIQNHSKVPQKIAFCFKIALNRKNKVVQKKEKSIFISNIIMKTKLYLNLWIFVSVKNKIIREKTNFMSIS